MSDTRISHACFKPSAFGSTPEEALHEVSKAKTAWLDAARSAGKSIPEPRYRPEIYRANF